VYGVIAIGRCTIIIQMESLFQHDATYVCGTDKKLLKWNYLDTVPIDVEIQVPNPNQYNNNVADENDDVLDVGVLGEERTLINMTRFTYLHQSERRCLEADRHEIRLRLQRLDWIPPRGSGIILQ